MPPQEWYNNFKEVNPSGEVSRDIYRKLYSEKLFGEIGYLIMKKSSFSIQLPQQAN